MNLVSSVEKASDNTQDIDIQFLYNIITDKIENKNLIVSGVSNSECIL